MKKSKDVAVSDSQKRAVAALKRAEERRIEKEKNTIYLYCPQFKSGFYGLPFYAKSDDIAAQSFRSFIDSPDGTPLQGSDLFLVAEFDVRTGIVKPFSVHKFISY